MTYYLKDDDPIPGSDLAGYVADKCDEVDRLRAENERLRQRIADLEADLEYAVASQV
jgi:cell division protein FtsB